MGIFPLIHSDSLRVEEERVTLKRYLFPLYYYKQQNVPAFLFPGNAEVNLYFPLFFQLRYSEDFYFRSFLINLFAFDRSPAFQRWSFFYPFFTFSYGEHSGKNRFIRVFPLFIYSRTEEPMPSRYTSFLWPFYIYTHSPQREARVVFPFSIRFVTEDRDFTSRFIFYLRDERKGVYEKKFYLFPFLGWEEGEDYDKTHFIYPLGYRRSEETARKTRLRGVFSFYRDPAEEELRWSFLLGMFRYERDPDSRKWQFTPLIRYEREEEHRKFHFVPIVQRETSPEYKRWRFLGPLFTREIHGYENTLGHYLRLYNREAGEDGIDGDALFRLLEWHSEQDEASMNLNLFLLQLRMPWFH